MLTGGQGATPVVTVGYLGHEVTWTVNAQWTCTCRHRSTSKAPSCAHVIAAARSLPFRKSNALINLRRAAGYLPPGHAKPGNNH